MRIKEEKECRICGGELERVLDLGNIYPSSFVKQGDDITKYSKAPLILDKCRECGLVQLEHTVDLDSMYKKQYWYASSLNRSMVSSLKDVVEHIESIVELTSEDTVVDIGCNDGTLLSLYKSEALRVGFDPAPNLSTANCDIFVNDYFDAEYYLLNAKAKVITAIAMFYDLPDPNKFVKGVKSILDKDGIFVIQFTDLLSMFRVSAFDNICHEHLEYYRLEDVKNLLNKHELEVIDVSYNEVNGGSIRVIASHKGSYLPSFSVERYLEREKEYLNNKTFADFKERIEETKKAIAAFLGTVDAIGDTCFLLGASTKGNTFLQICGITDMNVPYAAEVNKEKFGLRTLGSNIQIISEEEAFEMNPNYFMVLPWHFKDSLLKKETIKNYIKNGGYLVFPLPFFEIIGKEVLNNE